MGSSGINASTWGLQLRVVYKQTCIKHPAFFFLPLVFLMFCARQRDLPILLEDHHLNLPSIQLLHQSRTTTPTLGRLMLGATVSTKTPTATRWRKSSSRTSVSLTRRKLAGHKTRRSAVQLCTRTVPVSLRLTLSAFASM